LLWVGFASGRGLFVAAGASAGLAMLAKGPVGLVLPGAVVVLFLLWSRRLRLLLDRRVLLGLLVFFLISAPWYAWVGAETQTDFLQGFFLKHNVGRFLSPMENHRGPVFYYLIVLAVGFVPWSVFLPLIAVDAFRSLKRADQESTTDPRCSVRFLCCWIAV